MSGSSDIRKSADPHVFTEDNYNTWRIQAETLLQKYQLWDYVEKEKKSILDVDKKKFSIKKDKQAKSELILCLSSSLLALVKNSTTAREVWSKLTNVDVNQDEEREDSIENSDTNDKDAIINDTDSRVDDCNSETINNSSVQNISEIKKSLTTIFSEKLFLRLKINGIKKLPDEQVIVNTVSDFINEIDKLSKTEINKLTTELLRGKLFDILLLQFNISPSQQGDCGNATISPASDAPPSTPSSGRSCGLCREKGHNRKTCPLNKSDDSASKPTARRSLAYKRTPRPPKPAASAPKSPSKILETPKKLYKCGFCGYEGHNKTTCWAKKIFTVVGFVFFLCLLYLFISFLFSEDHEKY